ncbi:hypothetical protein LWI28_000603 [Acer negundo]|uniref:Xylanase inhibitor C-terminal domain-containing protein n=1 Tax=Acer negundo TaxID=4023 RepID=A0AAD5J398_ACENE|nr:hypothetical protein LWI28_000603 [Acer negundo]
MALGFDFGRNVEKIRNEVARREVEDPCQILAYTKLEAEFVRYFSSFDQIERRQNCSGPIKFCYTAPLDFLVFPSMTYHFQGADLTIAPESSFIVYRIEKYFSLAIAPFGRHSVLGAFEQHNIRFVYDIDSNVLAFVPDDCSKDNA